MTRDVDRLDGRLEADLHICDTTQPQAQRSEEIRARAVAMLRDGSCLSWDVLHVHQAARCSLFSAMTRDGMRWQHAARCLLSITRRLRWCAQDTTQCARSRGFAAGTLFGA